MINNIADKVLNLTLKDVKIDVSDTGDVNYYGPDQRGKAALSVQGSGDVEIELDGDNELKSGTQSAGLEKTSTGTLTLKDDNNEAGSLTAPVGLSSAGIGGGVNGIGSKVTVSGAAQVTATGSGPDWSGVGTGATIGNGGSKTPDGPVDGKEIQADIST